jgi:hypothetical protein
VATCKWLLERGADPGAATVDGNTVLYIDVQHFLLWVLQIVVCVYVSVVGAHVNE